MNKISVFICVLLCIALLISACSSVDETVSDASDVSAADENSRPAVITPDPDVPSAPSAENPVGTYSVIFGDSMGITYNSDICSGSYVAENERITFSLSVSPFYSGEPLVYVNGKKLEPSNGAYSFNVTESTVVTVGGVSLAENSITGSGTSLDDPYVITTPVDLLYIATQVNAGNAEYISAYYCLDNDLDFSGEELSIIGDGSGTYSYFDGYFDGQDHTVSNFVINANSTPYVGLFGIMQANVNASQNATVYRLNLDNFKIVVHSMGESVFCGSFAGYGIGSNIILCNANNGVIELYGDKNSFSYVGGIIGFQQGLNYNDLTYLSSVTYTTSSVNVDCREGMIYSAGGITGYLASSDETVAASVNNCYVIGDVQGAMISGGIVGYMTEATSVVNCYSTGIVSSQTMISDSDNSEVFCHAYSGGIVGIALPDSIVAESFATGRLYCKAQLGARYEHKDGVLALASPVSDGDYASRIATVYSCLYAEDGKADGVNLYDCDCIKSKLHWNSSDWVFAENEYPRINLAEDSEYTFDITISFNGTDGVTITEFDAYMPLSFWYLSDILPSSLTVGNGDPHTSYGYFFDDAHTLPVTGSYIPTHDTVLYAAVADYSEVAGEYVIVGSDAERPAYITLNIDGSYTYTDVIESRDSRYFYDGEHIVLREGRFARFSSADSTDKYSFGDYYAALSGDRLEIIGGIIGDDTDSYLAFTEEQPLVAVSSSTLVIGSYFGNGSVYSFSPDNSGTKTTDGIEADFTYVRNGNNVTLSFDGYTENGTYSNGVLRLSGKSLELCDEFRGSWNVDTKDDKIFTFDGAGNWSYVYSGYEKTDGFAPANKVIYERKSGTYTHKYIDGYDTIIISGDGVEAAAAIIDMSLVVATPDGNLVCYRDGGYYGTWVYPEYGLTLKLYGILSDGYGSARVEYLYENGVVEFYDLSYTDEKDNNAVCLYYNYELFGRLVYNPKGDVLNSTIYVGTLGTYMENVNLYRIDDMYGEWISNKKGMETVELNGLGGYTGNGLNDVSGYITVNGSTMPYKLDECTLKGQFAYRDKVYIISYNEISKTFTLTDGIYVTEFFRKDELGGITLVSDDGTVYEFDGRGYMDSLGTMTVTSGNASQTYGYAFSPDGVAILKNGSTVGALTVDEKRNQIIIKIGTEKTLKIKTEFTGTWAMSGSLENLVIGTVDLNGRADGSINGKNTVFEYYDDKTMIFKYEDAEFYVIYIDESNLVVSQAVAWYTTTESIYCAHVDAVFGTWTNSLGASCEFDGMSNSTLTNGTAQSGIGDNLISYFYKFDSYGQFVLWTVDANGETLIYRLVMCDTSTRRAYINGDRAFTVEQGDNLYDSTFVDTDSKISYTFDGFGHVLTSEGISYEYYLVDINQSNATARVRIVIDGKSIYASLDFGAYENYTLVFDD